jgi:hypothetical protein
MRGEKILLLLLIFPISVTALSNSSLTFSSNSLGGGAIGLEGNDTLLMPKMSIPEGAVEIGPLDLLTVFSLNQSIIGSFLITPRAGASNLSVCVSPLNLSSYLSGDQDTRGSSGKECAKTNNGTSFKLSIARGGLYSLNFVDENKTNALRSMPLLITEGQTVLQMPGIVTSEEPFIQVRMNTTAPGNQSKFFAAIMISRKDYENASLRIAKNKTTNSLDITLSLASKSLQMKGPLRISSELLMNLLPLLPANSAVGLQESTLQGVDLILLPDKSWEKGKYILTGGIYSPGKGLLGIKQGEVEII